jgi:hypothetical protein
MLPAAICRLFVTSLITRNSERNLRKVFEVAVRPARRTQEQAWQIPQEPAKICSA